MRILTAEHKAKISAAMKGVPRGPHSVEHRRRLAEAATGKTGTRSSGWKGGRVFVGKYWRVYLPDHPEANPRGYVYEHRAIIERVIGRLLLEREVVHHADANPRNNEASNLVRLRHDQAHQRLHAFARRHGLPISLIRP